MLFAWSVRRCSNSRVSNFRPHASLIAACLLAVAWSNSAAEDGSEVVDPELSPLTRTLSVGVAAGIMRFDSNFKFTDTGTGRSVFIDSEGTFGLPEQKTIPVIYGSWRPSQKHGLGFNYFSVRRDSEFIAFDENLGDLNLTGFARLQDDSRFYGATYNYTLLQDDRALVTATVGINVIDLEYRFDASGTISIGDVPIESGEYVETISQIAPLPTIGIDTSFVLTPKWAFGARAAFVAGDVSDVKAVITEASIRAKYTFNRNFGLLFGLRYFDADIDISRSGRLDEINYGLDGLFIGIDVGY